MSPEGIVIAQTLDAVGGLQATSFIEPGYSGQCAVCEGNKVIAVFPNNIEAIRAAAYAISPDGGFVGVSIHPSSELVTHASFMEWLQR